MSEFSNRVEAQRQILRAVNAIPQGSEQLFSLNTAAIQRWAAANHIDPATQLLKLLQEASAQIFAMANHSDDPIAGTYALTQASVAELETQIKREFQR